MAKAVGQLKDVEQQLDLWHELRHIGKAEKALEKAAYAAMQSEWELEKEAKGMDPQHAMGGYVWQRYKETRVETEKVIAEYEQLHTVCLWAREAMEAVDPTSGRIRSQGECLAELQVCVELLRLLRSDAARKLASHLHKAGPMVLRYIPHLEAQMEGLKAEMGEEGVRRLCLEWRLLREVGKARRCEKAERVRVYQRAHMIALLHWGKGYASALIKVVGVLEGVMRGSSLAECVNSWLRPYARLMKGLGKSFLPLFLLYRNDHTFERGKRAGHSPLELAGVPTPEGDWLDWIGFGQPRQSSKSVRSLPKLSPAIAAA